MIVDARRKRDKHLALINKAEERKRRKTFMMAGKNAHRAILAGINSSPLDLDKDNNNDRRPSNRIGGMDVIEEDDLDRSRISNGRRAGRRDSYISSMSRASKRDSDPMSRNGSLQPYIANGIPGISMRRNSKSLPPLNGPGKRKTSKTETASWQ